MKLLKPKWFSDIIIVILEPSPRGRENSYALSPWERVGVRARKTENHYSSI